MIQKLAFINDLRYLKTGSLQPGTISVRVLSKRTSERILLLSHTLRKSYPYPISNYGVRINESAGNQIKYVNQHA